MTDDPIYYDLGEIQADIMKYGGALTEWWIKELRANVTLRVNDITNITRSQSGVCVIATNYDLDIRYNKYGFYFWDNTAPKSQNPIAKGNLRQNYFGPGATTVMDSLEEALRAAMRLHALAF